MPFDELKRWIALSEIEKSEHRHKPGQAAARATQTGHKGRVQRPTRGRRR